MLLSLTHRLLPLLRASLARDFDRDGAVVALTAVSDEMVQRFDLEACLLLRRYLAFCRAETGDDPAIVQVGADLRRRLEARFSRDPSDYNLLYVLALEDLAEGALDTARRRLRKVAQSRYRAQARAAAALAGLSP